MQTLETVIINILRTNDVTNSQLTALVNAEEPKLEASQRMVSYQVAKLVKDGLVKRERDAACGNMFRFSWNKPAEVEKVPEFEDVLTVARRWYYSAIRSMVDDAIEECKSKECSDEDVAREWMDLHIHQTIDGHAILIYTAEASMALAASDNEDAMFDETGETGTLVQRCFHAMRADAWQLLDARTDEWIPVEADEGDSADVGDIEPLDHIEDYEHCGVCGGELKTLGTLATTEHKRCLNCGAQLATTKED